MCTEIDEIQRNVKSAYHSQIHLKENIIWSYWGHPAIATGLINSSPKISDMINFLYSSIINYKAVDKPSSTKNYVPSETDGEDEKIWFIDQ